LEASKGIVLLVDDDRVIRRIVVAKLSGLGYEIVEAQDGQEAFDKLRDGLVPSVLITDQLMPRMNGLELVRQIRASLKPEVAKLPIIMLTARQSERDIIEGLEAGLDDYVIKPFSPDELAARVRTVLWRSERAG
jgi:DNA-binding response OmpR family regulator